MDFNDLTIREAKKLASMFQKISATPVEAVEDHGYQIVILDRGFVYVGKVTTDASWCYIKDAQNIRQWGTTKGLGELVNGPLPNTKLDITGKVRSPMRAVIGMIAVEASKWSR